MRVGVKRSGLEELGKTGKVIHRKYFHHRCKSESIKVNSLRHTYPGDVMEINNNKYLVQEEEDSSSLRNGKQRNIIIPLRLL